MKDVALRLWCLMTLFSSDPYARFEKALSIAVRAAIEHRDVKIAEHNRQVAEQRSIHEAYARLN